MKPRANADEYAVIKPLGTVIASGSTGIGSNVIVSEPLPALMHSYV
jgi:hypothetical protein